MDLGRQWQKQSCVVAIFPIYNEIKPLNPEVLVNLLTSSLFKETQEWWIQILATVTYLEENTCEDRVRFSGFRGEIMSMWLIQNHGNLNDSLTFIKWTEKKSLTVFSPAAWPWL